MKFFAVLALCVVGAIATPLTADQAGLVQSSWKSVSHNEVDILAAVFAAYPDIQAKFPQFAGKDLASVKNTAAFATHATRIVSFLSELIALSGSESNLAAIYGLVSKMGADHKNRGVTQAQFNEFRTALVSYISSHVSWGDNVAAAWTHALDNVFTAVFQIVTV